MCERFDNSDFPSSKLWKSMLRIIAGYVEEFGYMTPQSFEYIENLQITSSNIIASVDTIIIQSKS